MVEPENSEITVEPSQFGKRGKRSSVNKKDDRPKKYGGRTVKKSVWILESVLRAKPDDMTLGEYVN